jgi:hypothetical protein
VFEKISKGVAIVYSNPKIAFSEEFVNPTKCICGSIVEPRTA